MNKETYKRFLTKECTRKIYYFRPVEMKEILGDLPILKYCRPPWLADEENFSFHYNYFPLQMGFNANLSFRIFQPTKGGGWDFYTFYLILVFAKFLIGYN